MQVTPDVPTAARLSIAVVGCSALILVSFVTPFFHVPFGGPRYMQWLSGFTLLFGTLMWLRREHGSAALAARVVTVASAALLLLTVAVPLGFALAMRLFMEN